jgi:hypothetical protein
MIQTENEFLQLAMHNYDNPACLSLEEFNQDLNGFLTIKRALKKYSTERTNLHRLVNHMIIFHNCFGNATTSLLLYKIDEEDIRKILCSIMHYLGWVDTTSNLNMDSETIVELLKL